MKLRLLLLLSLLATTLVSCGTRRFYPLLSLQAESDLRARFEFGAAALLPSGTVAAISERDSRTLFEIAPAAGTEDGARAPRGGEAFELFAVTEPSQGCPSRSPNAWRRCKDRDYRGHLTVDAVPIGWLANSRGKVVRPDSIEDLTPYPCASGDCPERIMGVTDFSSTGRATSFRADQVVRAREQTERLFVLERREGRWQEVPDRAVDVLRQRLSDWGRANCEGDFVVEGLAFAPGPRTVFIGVNRCAGPAQTVLSYPLAAEERGVPAHLSVIAHAMQDAEGDAIAGPSEALSSLDFAYGHLWATTSWDDYGFRTEPAWGARLSVLRGDHLIPVPLPGPLEDRADALVILPNDSVPDAFLTARDPTRLFPFLRAFLLFDNDRGARDRSRPDATLLYGRTPVPSEERYVEVLDVIPGPMGDPPLGLNGFDFRWFFRDHRLGQLSVVASEAEGEAGAWTTSLGGLWQVRLGALGKASRAWPLVGKSLGHNRQAAELTDYAPAEELRFQTYRAVMTVMPWERSAEQVSVARVLEQARERARDSWVLPEPAAEGAGLVLQGFAIDTSPRAAGGICLSGMDLGVEWADPAVRDTVELRAALLGGICNDFDVQKDEEHHGLTTDASSGVRVTLYFAVVEGAEAHAGSVTVAERDLPARRTAPTGVAMVDLEPGDLPPLAPPVGDRAPWKLGNKASKDNVACMVIDEHGGTVLPVPEDRHIPAAELVEWQVTREGSLPAADRAAMAGSLSGFAFAFDLRGFDPSLWPEAYADVTELAARNQNVYIYRYLMRAWLDSSVFLEGGISHGIHLSGPGKDNAMPTASLLRADLTWWEELSAEPLRLGPAPSDRPKWDPNIQPEDGFLRWAHTAPLPEEAACLPR